MFFWFENINKNILVCYSNKKYLKYCHICVFSASDCYMKWHNLRSSYSRYLREIKKHPSGCNEKKNLVDATSFFNNYLSQHKQVASNMNCIEEEESEVLTGDKETNEDSNPCHYESCSGSLKPSLSSKQWKHCSGGVGSTDGKVFIINV